LAPAKASRHPVNHPQLLVRTCRAIARPRTLRSERQNPSTTLRFPGGNRCPFAPKTRDAPSIEAGAERVLFPGAVIPACLVTEVNSESPGPVIAHVTQAIYDNQSGRTVLIPQGARLIGDYRSSTRYGQSRVAIGWSRLIMLDGREIALAEAALDPAGAWGVSGEVDNHWRTCSARQPSARSSMWASRQLKTLLLRAETAWCFATLSMTPCPTASNAWRAMSPTASSIGSCHPADDPRSGRSKAHSDRDAKERILSKCRRGIQPRQPTCTSRAFGQPDLEEREGKSLRRSGRTGRELQ